MLCQLFTLSRLFHSRGAIGKSQCSPEPVAKRKYLSIIVNVMGVMNCVVLAAHDGIDVPIHSVMDIGCPYSSKKNHSEMGQVVAGDERQEINIWTCL